MYNICLYSNIVFLCICSFSNVPYMQRSCSFIFLVHVFNSTWLKIHIKIFVSRKVLEYCKTTRSRTVRFLTEDDVAKTQTEKNV